MPYYVLTTRPDDVYDTKEQVEARLVELAACEGFGAEDMDDDTFTVIEGTQLSIEYTERKFSAKIRREVR